MTAHAATVGTGNIAGVATAIAIGEQGALFWMRYCCSRNTELF
jgi:AGCS family alanine or glycine:cation symporter